MKVKTKKYKGFQIEHVAGEDQFKHGWTVFGDADFDLIEDWTHYQLDTACVSMPNNQGLEKTQMLYERVFFPPFKGIHEAMIKLELKTGITHNDILLFIFQLQFPSFKDFAHLNWPDDFFLASMDGLRLLFMDGQFKSLQLDGRFYIMVHDEAYHVGHHYNGTWVVDITRDKMNQTLKSIK